MVDRYIRQLATAMSVSEASLRAEFDRGGRKNKYDAVSDIEEQSQRSKPRGKCEEEMQLIQVVFVDHTYVKHMVQDFKADDFQRLEIREIFNTIDYLFK